MNIISGLCGLALLASTCLPSVPIKTEASVGVEVSRETLQLDFCDLDLISSIPYSYEDDTMKFTDIRLRLQYRVPKDIYSTFLEEDPNTIFGIGIFLVDKNLSIDSYNRRGIIPKTTFDEYFQEDLSNSRFFVLKCNSEKYSYVGADDKEIDSKYASYIQYAQVFTGMLGNEDDEMAVFSFMESSGDLCVTSTEIVSVRKVAEKYVKTGKTPYEKLSDEAIEALCHHFDLTEPWHRNFFQRLFSNPLNNWKTPQWITAGIACVVLIIILIVVFKK